MVDAINLSMWQMYGKVESKFIKGIAIKEKFFLCLPLQILYIKKNLNFL